MCFEGDPEAALVTFQTRPQATACYRNPEPVFNNRFIKLFWHNKDKGEENNGTAESPSKPSVKERLGIPPAHKLQLNNTLKNKQAAAVAAADNEDKVLMAVLSSVCGVAYYSSSLSGFVA